MPLTMKQVAIVETFNALLAAHKRDAMKAIGIMSSLGIGYDEFKDAVIACGGGDEEKLAAALHGRPIGTWW